MKLKINVNTASLTIIRFLQKIKVKEVKKTLLGEVKKTNKKTTYRIWKTLSVSYNMIKNMLNKNYSDNVFDPLTLQNIF